MKPLQERARVARHGTLALLGLLVLALALETPFLMPPGLKIPAMLLVMALKTAPLCFFFLPVGRGRAMSAVWLGFLLMLYFCWAVLGAFTPGTEGRLALVRIVLITACFAAAMLFARWQSRSDAG
jgi:uncharacterized membrane protein